MNKLSELKYNNTIIKESIPIIKLSSLLKKNPLYINIKNNNKDTFLSLAIKNNEIDKIELLLASLILNLNYQDKDGNTYLHLFIIYHIKINLIIKLINKGINLNKQNNEGNTALHLAYLYNTKNNDNEELINLLIERRINVSLKNKNLKKAIELDKFQNSKIEINKSIKINWSTGNTTGYNYSKEVYHDYKESKDFSYTKEIDDLFKKNENNEISQDEDIVNMFTINTNYNNNKNVKIKKNIMRKKYISPIIIYNNNKINKNNSNIIKGRNNNIYIQKKIGFTQLKVEKTRPSTNSNYYIKNNSYKLIRKEKFKKFYNFSNELIDDFYKNGIGNDYLIKTSNRINLSENSKQIYDNNNFLMIKNKKKIFFNKKSLSHPKKNIQKYINNSKQTINKNPLYEFLEEINMQKYYLNLISNGFNDINLLIKQINTKNCIKYSDLIKTGINKAGDRAKILIRLEEKADCFNFIIPNSIYYFMENFGLKNFRKNPYTNKLYEWMKKNEFEEYIDNFLINSYFSIDLLFIQMISKNPLTNDILKNEIGIENIEHRNKILNILKDESNTFCANLRNKVININKEEDSNDNCLCNIY